MSLAPVDISVVIPAYNEAKRIENTLVAIAEHFQNLVAEIIVVDDGSQDATVSQVKKLDLPQLQVISYPANRGKGYAVRQGVLASRGHYVLISDADLSTPMSCFEDLWQQRLNYPVVLGSRGLQASEVDNHWYRVWLGKMGNRLIQVLTPGIVDTQCGFKLFEGEVARQLFAQQRLEGFGFDFEVLSIAHRMGLPIVEVPVRWVNAAGSKVRPLHYLTTLREWGQVWLNHRKSLYQYGFTRSKIHD